VKLRVACVVLMSGGLVLGCAEPPRPAVVENARPAPNTLNIVKARPRAETGLTKAGPPVETGVTKAGPPRETPALLVVPDYDCEFKTSEPRSDERQKLDYEAQCYRHAYLNVR